MVAITLSSGFPAYDKNYKNFFDNLAVPIS